MNSFDVALTSLPSSNLGIVKVPDEQFIYNFADRYPNVTSWAVSFDIYPSVSNSSVTNYAYTLWFNNTRQLRNFPITGAPPFVPGILEPYDDNIVGLMRGIDEAISTPFPCSNNSSKLYRWIFTVAKCVQCGAPRLSNSLTLIHVN